MTCTRIVSYVMTMYNEPVTLCVRTCCMSMYVLPVCSPLLGPWEQMLIQRVFLYGAS